MDIFYKLLVIAVGLAGLFVGLQKGMVAQAMSLLGVAFGIVVCRVFSEQSNEMIRALLPDFEKHFAADIVYNVMSSAIVFAIVYAVFFLLSILMRSVFSAINLGTFDSILGGAFGMLKYMFILSIVFNLIATMNPDSALIKNCEATDGNLIEIVMPIAPILLNNGFDRFQHILQLEEAKKISDANQSKDIQTTVKQNNYDIQQC